MIAMNNQSFSTVEDQCFIELLAELEPRYVIPSTMYFNETMLSLNIKFCIARKWRVSTLAKKFVTMFRICFN